MADPVTMLSDEHIMGTISGFVDANGNPATVDGPPRWTSSDEAVFTVVVSADGMSADIRAVDMMVDAPAAMATLTMAADENGVAGAITNTFDVVISSLNSPAAVGAAITFGAPSKK